MKQGVVLTVFVLMFTVVCIPLAAQDSGVNYQTYMVETFDSPESSEITWNGIGSKFITEGYPILKYFDGMPNALRVMQSDAEQEYKFLGVQFKFNRKGDNWVDIYPTKGSGEGDNAAPYEIPFKGIVQRLDLWVWGVGYAYDLEILVRDCNGRIHTLPVATLNYYGWRNLAVTVPSNIQQRSRYLSQTKNMSFVAFRIRTQPTENVDDFYIFFDEFKALTNTRMASYDGFELEKAQFADTDSNKEGGK
ncbi:MAG: flagellar filament outer layer protein FlaA [Treponema sp.]|uniref:flagellar filament outer layer protein FlaA n=1 Tax=Treponema sp. TaxID=166 RepID=UPI003FA292DF